MVRVVQPHFPAMFPEFHENSNGGDIYHTLDSELNHSQDGEMAALRSHASDGKVQAQSRAEAI